MGDEISGGYLDEMIDFQRVDHVRSDILLKISGGDLDEMIDFKGQNHMRSDIF